MNRIENEQIKFFFKHEARIREWANLKTEANKFVDRFYRSLKGDIDAALRNGRIADDGIELYFYKGKRNWSRLALRRLDWYEKADVGLDWKRNKGFRPYGHLDCGVWISDKKYSDPFTKEACPDYPKCVGSYPAYKEVEPPNDGFWEDDNFKEYREHLVETIFKAWNDLAPLVDEAIGHRSC